MPSSRTTRPTRGATCWRGRASPNSDAPATGRPSPSVLTWVPRPAGGHRYRPQSFPGSSTTRASYLTVRLFRQRCSYLTGPASRGRCKVVGEVSGLRRDKLSEEHRRTRGSMPARYGKYVPMAFLTRRTVSLTIWPDITQHLSLTVCAEPLPIRCSAVRRLVPGEVHRILPRVKFLPTASYLRCGTPGSEAVR